MSAAPGAAPSTETSIYDSPEFWYGIIILHILIVMIALGVIMKENKVYAQVYLAGLFAVLFAIGMAKNPTGRLFY